MSNSNNKYKTLVSNTMLISLGTFGSKLLVFFMVRFYTSCLTPADYGTADLITQTANLLFPLISLGITDGVFRFAVDHTEQRRNIFSVGVYTILAGAVLLVAILPLLGLFPQFDGFLWLIALYTMCSCFHSLCAQFVRAEGHTALFAVQGMINTVLVIGLNVLFLVGLRMGITGYVLSVALADLACTLLLFVRERLWRQLMLRPGWAAAREMLAYSIPMIPTTVFWWITSVSDRYMVTAYLGVDANGIYAVSYKMPTILSLVSSIFMEAWQFSAVSEAQGSRREHIRFFSKVWCSFQSVMFLAGACIIAFAVPEREEDRGAFLIAASHTDSPTYKLKTEAEVEACGRYIKLNVEGYGGMIAPSWMDRPLSVAGRAVVRQWAETAVECPYNLLERVKQEVTASGGILGEIEYGAQVLIPALLPAEDFASYAARITELTAGQCEAIHLGECFRAAPVAE